MADIVLYADFHGTVLVDKQVPCVITQQHTYAFTMQFQAMQEVALSYLETHSTPLRP